MVDAVANFAYTTVATPPSPATTGTSLVVASGTGGRFPAIVPFNLTVWPAGTQPLASNAEIVRVTAGSGDTFTIVRAQEGSTARTIVAGDQIAQTITADLMLDTSTFAAPNKSIAMFQAYNATAGLQGIGTTIAAVGTATATSISDTNIHTRQKRLEFAVTTAATTAVAGWREASNAFQVRTGFFYTCRFGPSRGNASNSTRRMFVGLTSVNSAATDVNPSGIADAVGVGCDSGDTNWQIMYRTGSGTVVKVDTGITKSAADNTEAYTITMNCDPGASTISFIFRNMTTGTTFYHTSTTAIPAAGTLLALRGMASVGGTSSVIGISLMSYYIETTF